MARLETIQPDVSLGKKTKEKIREDLIRSEIINKYKKPAFKRPDALTQPKSSELLSPAERASELMLDLHLQVSPTLSNIVDHGIGRQPIGKVSGRKGEDSLIGIDEIADLLVRDALKELTKKHKLSLAVFSEHGTYIIGEGRPEFFIALDPYENSDEYEKGLDTNGHLVATIYDMNDQPVAAGDSNLVSQHAVINYHNNNWELNNKTREAKQLFPPRLVRSISDPKCVIACYIGRDKYSRPFNANLDRLNKDRNPKSTFHGKAGTHIYEALVRGAVSANVMIGSSRENRGEPVSEVWPAKGLLLKNSKIKIYSVDKEDGHLEELKMNHKRYLDNPNHYAKDRIDFLISANPELARQIRNYAFTKPFPGWNDFVGKL